MLLAEIDSVGVVDAVFAPGDLVEVVEVAGVADGLIELVAVAAGLEIDNFGCFHTVNYFFAV